MDYRKAAQDVCNTIGGKENVVSVAHCATRLRLVIADNSKCNKAELEEVEGVKGVFEASGQLQVIFGTGTVNKVYDEFLAVTGMEGGTKEEVKQAAAAKQNIFKRAIKTLGDVFVPIIPAIVASGLLMGLLEGLCNMWPEIANSGTYTIIHLFSNAAFVFLPILIAISAAKVFGGNMFLGAVIGMIMIHSDLINAWSVSGLDPSQIPTASVFGLYQVQLVGYQGHVIPVVIAVWFMSFIEKKLHKIVPEIIDLFVTPLVTVLVTGYLTLTVIGPIFSMLENYVLQGAQFLIAIPFGIGGFLVGGLYAPTVVAGVHHMYNAIEAGLLSSQGLNTWMPIATAANVAQGAAALALAIKTKNAKTKSVALPASLSAFLGITEPAIFGVNIRFMKPFVAGCIGGACGGLVAGFTGIGATAYGITGLFGFLITTDYTVSYALVILVASAVAFALSWWMFKEPEAATSKQESGATKQAATAVAGEKAEMEVPKKESVAGAVFTARDTEEQASGSAATADGTSAQAGEPQKTAAQVGSPLKGKVIALSEVPDETFAAEVLGKGVAVEPAEGKVVAPASATVETLFPTKHAIGLRCDNGVELLIHIGINTVELDGKYYKALVKEGDHVQAGQTLITFDQTEIEHAGYKTVTPVLVTNTDDYQVVAQLATGAVEVLDPVIAVK